MHTWRDGVDMQSPRTPFMGPRVAGSDVGAPALLLVSLGAEALMVLAIAMIGMTGAAWAAVAALLAHAFTTAVVTVAVMRMLANADSAER